MGLVVNRLIDSLSFQQPARADRGRAGRRAPPTCRSISAARSSRAAASCCTPPTTSRTSTLVIEDEIALTATIDVLKAIARGDGPAAPGAGARLRRLGRRASSTPRSRPTAGCWCRPISTWCSASTTTPSGQRAIAKIGDRSVPALERGRPRLSEAAKDRVGRSEGAAAARLAPPVPPTCCREARNRRRVRPGCRVPARLRSAIDVPRTILMAGDAAPGFGKLASAAPAVRPPSSLATLHRAMMLSAEAAAAGPWPRSPPARPRAP